MSGTVALVVAAGRGMRFGGEVPKQYRPLGGKPVLRHALERLRAHPDIAAVRAVISPEDRRRYDVAAKGLDLLEPVAGGATRQQSVRNGLESLVEMAPDLVLIHDAARPFVDAGVIDRVLEGLRSAPGAIAALPVVDTIKRAAAEKSTAAPRIEATAVRERLWRAQTPQGFRFEAILAAHRAAAGTEHTDDAAVAEAAGLAVTLVMGAEENFKITTEADLQRAERLVGEGSWEYRSASGYDVHRFKPGDAIMLCGVRVPHTAALEGHSDADVGLHALTDALLGAIGAGDIGQHFPPSDPKWRGADSARFLAHAAALVVERGGRIAHLDVTIICERPKVGPHRAAMIERIAAILKLDPSRVSVKATTTEGLGFTGRGEGIAAQATATVALPA
ncbi:MAG: bifunctional 2-C-methyl-D-erythritol 4-phosphate cytidylyltransferase/2-C-methyl-D-erythritol 2,4-cyclodiphosphate synthase [Pseudomonadota bacterium]